MQPYFPPTIGVRRNASCHIVRLFHGGIAEYFEPLVVMALEQRQRKKTLAMIAKIG